MDISEDEEPQLPSKRHVGLEEAVFIVLVILSLTGISITRFSIHDGYGYWLFMVFVFAALSIFVSWLQAKAGAQDFGEIVKQQGMHWLHTLLIVGAAFFLNKSGQLTEIGASLVILLILALATILDGYRIGWQFRLLGFFLVACSLIIAYIEQYIWTCIGLGALLIIVTVFWSYRTAQRRQYADN